ncbi:MAG: hypothetical protein IPN72_24305 [Saprospiraceae bacterium]|nr:hypothetical protein [Saprospiraceae bacterium]
MKRRNFIALAGTTIVTASGIYYLSSDTGTSIEPTLGINPTKTYPSKMLLREISYF